MPAMPSRKGSPNQIPRAVKEMVRQALNKSGGVSYLVKQAKANPTAFLTLVGKLIPTEVSGPEGEPIAIIERRVVRPGD